MNDPGLLDRLRKGEETAFKELVESCKDLVYNTALGIVQNEVEAEDVAQEVFVQAFQSMSTFKGESKLSTWLYRITVTKSLDHARYEWLRNGRLDPNEQTFNKDPRTEYDG